MSLVKMLVSLSAKMVLKRGIETEICQYLGVQKENNYIYSPLFSFALTGVGEDVGEGVGS